MNTVVKVSLAFLGALLAKAANVAWDDLWTKLLELEAKAEELYYSEAGQMRKDWVIAQTMLWLDENIKPTGIQRLVLKFALSTLVDGFIKALNDTLGHDWISKAKEVEQHLADMLPVIE
jgi:hypothetical protein